MMSTKRRRLALSYLYYHYLLLIILLLFGSGQAFSHRPRGRPQPREYDHPCCEVIHVTSTSYAEEFHPQHMGAYKIMRNQKNVYRHLSNPRSFIYLLQLPTGKPYNDFTYFSTPSWRWCSWRPRGRGCTWRRPPTSSPGGSISRTAPCTLQIG